MSSEVLEVNLNNPYCSRMSFLSQPLISAAYSCTRFHAASVLHWKQWTSYWSAIMMLEIPFSTHFWFCTGCFLSAQDQMEHFLWAMLCFSISHLCLELDYRIKHRPRQHYQFISMTRCWQLHFCLHIFTESLKPHITLYFCLDAGP